ncbi:unnamed protein product [Oikopleura dioica]|uniref:Fibrinogen C-terminal domain-containing protein n=1 Tax=Oikopleura dioica TaxID=34765 RepID=E4X6T6_OIKDI|nr:unnamed protein product [Oikopleura dioica]
MAFAPRYGGNSAFLRTNTLVCENFRVMGENCNDIWDRASRNNRPKSGIYKIQMPGLDAKDVHCVFDQGSPKTVIQKRTTGDLNFNRDWRDYKYGFSTNVEASPYMGRTMSGGQRGPRPSQCNLKEYWIGLEYIHALTNAGFNNLRIDLERWNGEEGTVTYGNFDIASERDQYRLNSVGIFKNDGNRDLGDAFRGTGFGDQGYSQYDKQDTDHESMAFSTYDRDNDLYEEGNCAREDGSGWWFNRCSAANLNGKHYGNRSSAFKAKNDASFDDGILWMTWTQNKFESLTGTTMMLGGIDINKAPLDSPTLDNCQAHADSLFLKEKLNEQNAEDFNGVYKIWADRYRRISKEVECKFYVKLDTPCGLTLIQKRKDGSEDFNRNWADYKKGFGFDVVANRGPRPGKSLGEGVTEGWLGNDAIWHLTNNLNSQGLLVEMDRKYDPRTKSDNSAACRYNEFKIGDERSRYTLTNINGYSSVSGNPGDAFAGADFGREGWGNDREITQHRGMKFSTKDQDNDADEYYHCAKQDKSGWWFNGCSAVNLNGHYYSSGVVEGGSKGSQMTATEEFDDGILWETWTASKWESLTATRMYVGDSDIMNVIFTWESASTIYPDDCDREDSSTKNGCNEDPTNYSEYNYENRNGKPDYDDFYSN